MHNIGLKDPSDDWKRRHASCQPSRPQPRKETADESIAETPMQKTVRDGGDGVVKPKNRYGKYKTLDLRCSPN